MASRAIDLLGFRPTMRILKFGGTSLATPERMGHVARLVAGARSGGSVVVVVSAMGGVTNELLRAADEASQRDAAWKRRWQALYERHLDAAQSLGAGHEELATWLRERFADLEDLLHGVFLLRECSPRTRDSIVSFGERLSAPLLAFCLEPLGIAAEAIDARQLIVTDATFGQARVEAEATRSSIRSQLLGRSSLPVVTGFVAATSRGETTTLGRGGSDLTASLLGEALEAEVIELWTDVSGVLSADPRKVPEAFPLPRISYDELMELSHFGAKVVHPPSVHPARRGRVPLAIRNTLDPDAAGTLITDASSANRFAVRGITSIPAVDLLRLEGDGMVGVPGIANRLFGCLARADVSVILISQASSEHSICFAVAPESTEAAAQAIHSEFELELRVGAVDPLIIDRELSVVAVVGEEMRERPGIASRLFGALGDRRINVRAVAQGSSELNISLVVSSDDEVPALRAIHSTFFGTPLPRVDLILVGCGNVGRAVLEQSSRLLERWREQRGVDLRWVALANSRQLLIDDDGIPPHEAESRLRTAPAGTLNDLLTYLDHREVPGVVLDLTASDQIGSIYHSLLSRGYGLVAANKKPFCEPWTEYVSWTALARRHRTPLYYEATVGAGLPVLSTLTHQLAAGDALRSLVGVVSGSLNFLCEELRRGRRFSEALDEANRRGYLEPVPWDDLSGRDAQRKVCILARLAGVPLELEEVEVESFLGDPSWADLAVEEFWARVPQLDADFERRRQDLEAAGLRWRYVIEFDGQKARAGLREVGPDHPCFDTVGPESLVAFTTDHYCDLPLTVRGPGAGPAVTASGVLVDVVRCLETLAPDRPHLSEDLP